MRLSGWQLPVIELLFNNRTLWRYYGVIVLGQRIECLEIGKYGGEGGERNLVLSNEANQKKIISSYKNVLSLFTVFFTKMRWTFTGRSHPVKQTWRPWKRNKRPFSSVDSKTKIRWNSGSSARFQIFTLEELKPYHHGISVLLVKKNENENSVVPFFS